MQKILIIEDDLIDQMAFTRMFEKENWDYQYAIANSVKEAKIELSQHQYDLVISDHNLADGTAFDLLKDLKNIPFILITGNEDDATISAVINNSNAIANFNKDLNFNYLKKLPHLITQILNKEVQLPKDSNPSKNIDQKTKIIEQDNVKIELSNAFKIFDGRKEDVKEVIEIFIHHKPIEMNDLYNYLNTQDCEKVRKVSHRIKSGYRLLGMTKQEALADHIEQATLLAKDNCAYPTVIDAFKQLSSDTKIAIELLKKELPLL